jgi:hypothetical protein
MKEGLVDSNPVIATNRHGANKPRERVLTMGEIAEIWHASGNGPYGAIVKLLILTGQRRTEIGSLCWREIDVPARLIRLPGERCKNHRPHDVPLSDPAMELMQATPRVGEFVFGTTPIGFSPYADGKHDLDERIAIARGPEPMPPWVLHDLRRSVATHMAEIGVQPHIVEAVLNHTSGHKNGVAGVYNRATYVEEKRQALCRCLEIVQHLLDEGNRVRAKRANATGRCRRASSSAMPRRARSRATDLQSALIPRETLAKGFAWENHGDGREILEMLASCAFLTERSRLQAKVLQSRSSLQAGASTVLTKGPSIVRTFPAWRPRNLCWRYLWNNHVYPAKAHAGIGFEVKPDSVRQASATVQIFDSQQHLLSAITQPAVGGACGPPCNDAAFFGFYDPQGRIASVAISPNSGGGFTENQVSLIDQPQLSFAGTPGQPNCHSQSIATLAGVYGGLDSAAAALGLSGVSALQKAVGDYCGG